MSYESENWDLIQRLFYLAEETPAEDRARVLAENCHDPRIVQRALEILESSLAAEVSAGPVKPQLSPSRLGPYSLLRLIGSGGIGTVYLAERMMGGAPHRSALKVLAPHAAGPSFVERFRREQHILASLDHTHITKFLDAGLSENGQPYFVMEYVDGEHLDKYCDGLKLGINQRIDIFLQVCNAVMHAHRNLVVHLDLKPSNILVDEKGSVKLLDFGTSKLVQTDSLMTTTVLATPAYASPEQLRNEPVTTACDVYSLGVVLFELLSGSRPNQSAAIQFERAFVEREPASILNAISAAAAENRGLPEARLRSALAGDLATIAAKCLRARPKDRYASVDALAEDLRRYRDGRAVLARPQTLGYTLGRFVHRNRVMVSIAAAVLVLLLASVGYAGWRQEQAMLAGERALRMQTFLYSLFRIANSNYTGKPAATVPEFLNLGVKLLPRYIKDPADQREAELSLAESMFENGALDDAQKVFEQVDASAKAANDVSSQAEAEAFAGNIDYQNGDLDKGAALTASALALSAKAGIPAAIRVRCEDYFAVNRENNGYRSEENLRLLQDAVHVAKTSKLATHETADALYSLASDLELRGRLDEAEPIYNEALQTYGEDPSELCSRSNVLGDLAFLHEMKGDIQGALPAYRQSYAGFAACSGPEGRDALTQQDSIAGALIKLGRAPEAVPLLEKNLPVWRKILGTGPDLAEPLFYLSTAYVDTGRYKEAEKTATEMITVQTGKVAPTDRRIGASHLVMAKALVGQGRYEDALPHAVIADQLLSKNGISAGAKAMGQQAHEELAEIQSKVGR